MSFIDVVKKTTSQIGGVVKKTYGPLAVLEGQQFTSSILRYPTDVGNAQRFPHTVEFQAWLPTQTTIGDIGVVQATQNKLTGIANEYASGAVSAYNRASGGVESITKWIADKSNAAVGAVKGSPTDFFGARTLGRVGESYVDPYDADMMKVDRNKAYSDRLFDFKRRATRSDVITMYMPQGTYNDRINNAYNQKSMTEAIGLTGGVLEVMSALSKENITTMDMLNGPAGMEVIGQVAGSLGMDAGTITDAGLAAIGYALNPQFEMLYNGTDLREFQFDFTMTPRSVDEAVMINDIINKFKYHGSPQFLTGQGRYIVPPSYFDITFNFNGSRNEWLPQISTCVLKSVDIDYTGGLEQWASFSDGSPVQVKMVLVFVELEMMHKKLREEGY